MGRPQTIYVDSNALLAGIARATREVLADIDAELAELNAREAVKHDFQTGQTIYALERYRRTIKSDGVLYDLSAFAGRRLSPSERIRYQQALRAMAATGLVELLGKKARRVKITPAGLAAIDAKLCEVPT